MEQMNESVNQLSRLVDGYSILVRNYKLEKKNLIDLLKYAIDNEELRLKAHNIEVIIPKTLFDKKIEGVCSENYFVNAVMNLFDNSIWWLQYAKIENPKIYITISEERENYSTLVFADNGPGFAIPKDILGTAFITAKPAGLGMGIGLHLTKEIMLSSKGDLLFPEPNDFEIPNEFRKGAIIALSFRKE